MQYLGFPFGPGPLARRFHVREIHLDGLQNMGAGGLGAHHVLGSDASDPIKGRARNAKMTPAIRKVEGASPHRKIPPAIGIAIARRFIVKEMLRPPRASIENSAIHIV